MAREDLLAQLLRDLIQKEDPPPPDDNSIIPKMVAPNDKTTAADDAPTFTHVNPSGFKWGGVVNGSYVSPGWKWGQGQYKSNPGSWAWGFRAKTWNDVPNGTTWNSLQSG